MATKKNKKKPGKRRLGNTAALKRGQAMMQAAAKMFHAGEAPSTKAALKVLAASGSMYAANPKAKKAKKSSSKKRTAPKGAKARMAKASAMIASGRARTMPEALQMLAGSRSLLY